MLSQLEQLWTYAQSIDNEDGPDNDPPKFK